MQEKIYYILISFIFNILVMRLKGEREDLAVIGPAWRYWENMDEDV